MARLLRSSEAGNGGVAALHDLVGPEQRPARTGEELLAFFRRSPFVGEDIDLVRDRSTGRSIDHLLMGVLLDTNVVSELVGREPAPAVPAWLGRVQPDSLFLGDPTIGELVRGAETAPTAARRRALERWVREDLAQQFHQRILAFDRHEATVWGRLVGEGERTGRVPAVIDAQLAAIALAHGHAVATRDTAFDRLGVERIDPWSGS